MRGYACNRAILPWICVRFAYNQAISPCICVGSACNQDISPCIMWCRLIKGIFHHVLGRGALILEIRTAPCNCVGLACRGAVSP